MVHVYRCPLSFKSPSGGQEEACLYLCDCQTMARAREIMSGMETSTITASDCRATLQSLSCQHSLAVEWLHKAGNIPYNSSLGHTCSMLDDIPFLCKSSPVTVLRTSPSLLMSCDFSTGGLGGVKRGIITADASGCLRCLTCPHSYAHNCQEHLKPLAGWLESEGGDVFDGLYLRSGRYPLRPPMEQDDVPKSISHRSIPLDFCNDIMIQRATFSK